MQWLQVRPRSRLDVATQGVRAPIFWLSWILILVVPLVLVPWLQSQEILNSYYYDVLVRMGIAVIWAVSLNMVNGHLGQFSIGHAGFAGVGAFVSGMLIAGGNPGVSGVSVRDAGFLSALPSIDLGGGYEFSAAFLVAMLMGGVAAAMIAFVIGLPSFRTRGDYLAVVTLAFNMIIVNIFLNMDYVGGARGLTGLPELLQLDLGVAGSDRDDRHLAKPDQLGTRAGHALRPRE